jgi:REP element-mobilizing transposase RayT
MKYNPDIHHRRSIRLKGYDYSQAGAYFVTICTQNRECLFGDVLNGEMVLNDAGKIVADEWMRTGEIRDEIELDEWVVMPNHFHGIVMIRRGDRPVAPTLPGPRPKSIGSLMSGFKSAVTKRINDIRNSPGAKIWQRNYYEHIICNENELNSIREYIVNNPLKWEFDRENPDVSILEISGAQREGQS